MRKLYNRFNVKTRDFEYQTGNSGFVISSADMQAVLSSCEASPLTFAHWEARYQLGDTQLALKKFEKLLKPFMYNRLIASKSSISPKTLVKYHVTIVNALDDVSDCVFRYLTRNKIKTHRIRAFMPPNILADTFRRRYSKFMRRVIGELEQELDDLEYQIMKKVLEYNTKTKLI